MKRRSWFLAIALLTGAAALAVAATSEPPVTLSIDAATIAALKTFRATPKFLDLPGAPAEQERRRLEPLINALADRLIAGIEAHPTDTWVLEQMTPTVEAFYLEDTEARERCVDDLAQLFRILGIHSDRGAFARFFITI